MLTLTENDADRTVELHVGDTVRISLPENATTGYRWTIDRTDEQSVELAGSEPHYKGGKIGAGGESVFTFRARKPGDAEIVVKHWRDWEGDASVTKRFRVRVKIQP